MIQKVDKIIKVSAPGKIILSGEHAVVYGYPALVTAVDRRINIQITETDTPLTLKPDDSKIFVKNALAILKKHLNFSPTGMDIVLNSNIPIGRGMGSSAAFSVALSKALLTHIGKSGDLKKVSDLANELEKKYHGNPSGVDIAISTHGGVLWFRKETQGFKIFSEVRLKDRFPDLFLLDTGKPEETTKETVTHVLDLLKKKPRQTERTFKAIESVTRAFLEHMTGEKNYDLVELFKANERLLEDLGVVSSSTINLIRKIEKIGGAAKISGGGGKKEASGILLVYHPNKEKLFQVVSELNLKLDKAKVGMKGVASEKRTDTH